MANMTPNPTVPVTYTFKVAPVGQGVALPVPNVAALSNDPNIKLILTVAADGTITSYNHPLTGVTDPAEEKLKDETGLEPYDVGKIWDLATLTFIIYQKEGEPAELGYWKVTSGGKIMIS
jgi:hypothetical protein